MVFCRFAKKSLWNFVGLAKKTYFCGVKSTRSKARLGLRTSWTSVAAPTLVETLKLRMYELGLTQTKLAEMLGLSVARVSEIMSGKGDRCFAR